ncbi:Bacteriophytochrome (light-regulated signal transduction histidine kinase) [Deinococcus hopiensis KR-140]|uniref:histidine kinase n=2 Tax=Deinococcus TaxID=1298 RepID=A0A1W1UPE1_9DEIO|nr:Bacteriophytochrome (light-regulated signal transduction histidine kinase) [Deinococcus hopiensis KR-140]
MVDKHRAAQALLAEARLNWGPASPPLPQAANASNTLGGQLWLRPRLLCLMTEPQHSSKGQSLAERLQGVTEALAAATNQADVFHVILHPALQALKARAGVVLLVHEGGNGLRVADTQGYAEGEQTLWQDGTFETFSPTEDCLKRHEALYFEHQDALLAAYPELTGPPLSVNVVATAVIPIFLQDRPLGVIVLVFTQPHEFIPQERQFLQTLAGQCALSLDRLALNTQFHQQAEALTAFVALTEAVGLNTDVTTLTQRANDVLRATFPDLFMSYYVLEEGVWVPAQLADVSEPLEQVLRAGLPQDTPAYQRAVQTRTPIFIDHWDCDAQQIPHTESFKAGVLAPYFQQGQPVGMLAVGRQDEPVWTQQHRAVITALWRSLGGALDRAEQARQLEGRAALNAFVALTEAVGTETELQVLARRAQEVLQASVPEVSVVYYELQQGLWKARVLSDNLTPEIVTAARLGFARDTPSFVTAVQTAQPVFADGWDGQREGISPADAYGAAALYPYFKAGQPFAMFTIGTMQRRKWTQSDRALFTAVGRSLGLALERAERVAELDARSRDLERSNARLEAANEELEAFTYSVSHDLRTPVRHIKGFNDLLRKTLALPAEAKAARYLGIVNTAAEQMNTLIDAMLDLSRTSRQPLVMGLVDLEVLITAARSELEPEIQEQHVVWSVKPLPLVLADHTTLRQVLINLLSNALKYSRTRPEAHIEIWAEERTQEWAVFVRDNGVGFDPRYTDKLFGVFQRLHRHEEFEGTGVGLANVRRIIARHGGTVFARSVLNEGATFGFTLPRPS